MDTDGGGEMADTEHTNEGSSIFHCADRTRAGRAANGANLLYLSRNGETRCGGAGAPDPRRPSVRAKAQRLGCDAYFDEERAEGTREADHGGDEQDGYGSRQVE